MKEEAQQYIVSQFAKLNHLEAEDIPIKLNAVIANAAAPFYLLSECLDPSGLSSSHNPVDGVVLTLINRLYEVVSSALILAAHGRLQQAEILSRTVMESALSVCYITQADTDDRLVRFFAAYIKQERDQNQKWAKLLPSLSADARADHEARIAAKNEAMEHLTVFVEAFAKEIGVTYPNDKGYPNAFDICAAVDKAVDYRTVYAAMCSQAHHDAEDILNELIVGVSANASTLSAQLVRETHNFSIFLMLHGIRYYLEAMRSIGRRYALLSVADQSARSYEVVSSLMHEVIAGDLIRNELDGWLRKI